MNETQLKLTDDEKEFFNELEQQEKAYKANSDEFEKLMLPDSKEKCDKTSPEAP